MRAKKLLGAVTAVAVAGLVTGMTTTTASAAGHHYGQHKLAHGMGLALGQRLPIQHNAQPVHARSTAFTAHRAVAQDSVDLPNEVQLPTIAPGDQGQVGSCVAWATTHSGYGVLMNEQSINDGVRAPMFIYAQIAKGNDQGTYGSVALQMEQEQGVSSAANYWQGDFDYTTQPDDTERAEAAHYKLSGYNSLNLGSGIKADVENALAQGMPVAIGLPVHNSFMQIDQQTASDYSYMPGDDSSDPVAGGHEITVVAYNDQGVTIENSWGSGWGNGGYINVSWQFMETQLQDAIAMGKLVQN